MSLQYRDKNGNTQIISGLTPGGNLEAGAVAQRRGSVTTPEIAVGGSYTATITFSEPMPDSDYDVIINKSRLCNAGVPYNKTINGFDLVVGNQSSSALSCNINYVAIKTYTVQHAEQTAADIADIKAMIPSTASSTNKFSTADDLRTETRALDRRLDDVEDVIPTTASITNQLATQNDLSNIEIDELGEINDVDLTNLADGQTLVWDDTTSKWVNGQGGKVYTAGDGIDISNADEISAKVNLAQFDFDAGGKMSLNGEYKKTFVGTKAEWDALSTSKKKEYTIANITNDVIGGEVADEVTDGLMSPVTSNAVYDFPIDSVTDGQHRPATSNAVYDAIATATAAIPNYASSSNKLVATSDLKNIDVDNYYTVITAEMDPYYFAKAKDKFDTLGNGAGAFTFTSSNSYPCGGSYMKQGIFGSIMVCAPYGVRIYRTQNGGTTWYQRML